MPLTGPGALSAPMVEPEALSLLPSVYDPPLGKPMPLAPATVTTEDDDEATEDERPPSAAPSSSRPPTAAGPVSAPPSRAPSPKPPAAGKPKKVGGTRATGGINLRVLIEEGYLQPGANVLSGVYAGRAGAHPASAPCCFCSLLLLLPRRAEQRLVGVVLLLPSAAAAGFPSSCHVLVLLLARPRPFARPSPSHPTLP